MAKIRDSWKIVIGHKWKILQNLEVGSNNEDLETNDL